ncbi:MAG: ORC1-type DNA replication protein [Candidatus Bathyarchaeota archaeon]|nr:ORC1-type DNA replication protein [Candidatus Bathyarchaeota archaeon]MDH5745448.1 ORC1-type DNA replication protein [Candidatus Bathyarchaeota archaeon]
MRLYHSVFKDETKLDINYVPYRLPHRDAELHLLAEFFSFMLKAQGRMAQRVIITGDIGTGKTVLSQRFGTNITREADKRGINLRYVHVNCREYRGSLFLILHHVVSIFHPNFPRRGYSAEELLRILLQVLDEQDTHVILTLDEFESLVEREGSEAVYKLTRLQEIRMNKPQRVSLICILRGLRAIEGLDASTRSTLQSNIIHLERYSEQHLMDILNDRVSLAFKPLTVPEDTLGLIAELAFSENGNARFGIELLWRAGKYADAEDLGIVAPECVRKAVSSIYAVMRKSDLASLSHHEKLFLLGVARLFKGSQKAYASLTEAERAYAVVCEEFDVQPHSHTQLWKYLQMLSALSIVKKKVSAADSRGRSTIVYLPRIPAHELEKELSTLLEKEA